MDPVEDGPRAPMMTVGSDLGGVREERRGGLAACRKEVAAAAGSKGGGEACGGVGWFAQGGRRQTLVLRVQARRGLFRGQLGLGGLGRIV